MNSKLSKNGAQRTLREINIFLDLLQLNAQDDKTNILYVESQKNMKTSNSFYFDNPNADKWLHAGDNTLFVTRESLAPKLAGGGPSASTFARGAQGIGAIGSNIIFRLNLPASIIQTTNDMVNMNTIAIPGMDNFLTHNSFMNMHLSGSRFVWTTLGLKNSSGNVTLEQDNVGYVYTEDGLNFKTVYKTKEYNGIPAFLFHPIISNNVYSFETKNAAGTPIRIWTTDHINYTESIIPFSAGLGSLEYIFPILNLPGALYTVNPSSTLQYSISTDDGKTWGAVQTLPGTISTLSPTIGYKNGVYVLTTGTATYTSATALTGSWSAATTPFAATGRSGLWFLNGYFIEIASTSGTQGMQYSLDGTTWTRKPVASGGVSQVMALAAYADGRYIIVGASGCEISTDLITWTYTAGRGQGYFGYKAIASTSTIAVWGDGSQNLNFYKDGTAQQFLNTVGRPSDAVVVTLLNRSKTKFKD